jgi:hypothetical protein
MLKMQIGPEKCMKTKDTMTNCPRKRAILRPKLQNPQKVFVVFARDLRPEAVKECIKSDLTAEARRRRGTKEIFSAPPRLCGEMREDCMSVPASRTPHPTSSLGHPPGDGKSEMLVRRNARMLQKTRPFNDVCEVCQKLYLQQNKPIGCCAGLSGGKMRAKKMRDNATMLLKTNIEKMSSFALPRCL